MLSKEFFNQFGSPRRIASNLVLLALGSAMCAVAINGILVPHDFVSGGLVGIALLANHYWPGLSIALMLLAMNAAVFLVGWRYVGIRFLLYSLIGTVFFIAAVAYLKFTLPIEDKMLAALLAGIITGAGAGLIFRSQGSAGGLDILAVIMLENFSVRLGSTSLAFNSFVLAMAAVIISLQGALYTLVFLFVTAQVTDLVVTGLSKRKVVHIISEHWEEIARRIQQDLKRGVTLISARGGYTGAEKQIIYTVVTFRDLPRLKRLASAVDPGCFIIINDTLEVVGASMGSMPQWSGNRRPVGTATGPKSVQGRPPST